MKILCKSPGSPQHESCDFLRISLKDTPADGYEPMAGGVAVRIPGTDWWLEASSKNME
jgi:hypothetical protein